MVLGRARRWSGLIMSRTSCDSTFSPPVVDNMRNVQEKSRMGTSGRQGRVREARVRGHT
jgi:hypothetical protein